MITPRRVRGKIKDDHVLNLSELAIASGYPRGVLARMNLPMFAGKISLSDFKRIMRKRQDEFERARGERYEMTRDDNGQVGFTLLPPPPGPSSPGDNGSPPADADRLYAPSSKRADKAASRPARITPLARSTA